MTAKDSHIIILGSGAWGLSTALHLINSGHVNVTVIDRAETIPSRYSAAWDLNKIVRAEYEDAFYTDLALVGSLFTISLIGNPIQMITLIQAHAQIMADKDL